VPTSASLGPIELFVDLNCPFCFCQIDRVLKLGVGEIVTWRGVEHAPDLPAPPDRRHPFANRLRSELKRLKEREPDFVISDPGFVVSTNLVNQWLQAIARIAPSRLWEAVHAVGAALWRQQVDVSSRAELARIGNQLGLTAIAIEEQDIELVRKNSAQWRAGPFEGQLPAARSTHGATLLGLNEEERFSLFVRSGKFSVRNGDSCEVLVSEATAIKRSA
jgi:predicted DsbA family dithiol-disulfide isomerase